MTHKFGNSTKGAPQNLKAGGSSWAEIAGSSSRLPPKAMKLQFIPPVASEGRPRVVAETALSSEGVKEWAFTLVGQFVGTNLSFSAVRSIAKSIWTKDGLLDVLSYKKGYFLFRFASEAGMKSILERGPWLFAGRYLVLMKWRQGLALSKAMLHYIPVWAQFYNIPIELWIEKGLSLIASAIGKPLYADSATEARSRVNFARICVEVEAGHPLVEEFDVEMIGEDGSSTLVPIRVSYQWKSTSCSFCQVFGHSSDSCSQATASEVTLLKTSSSKEAAKPTQQTQEEGWLTVGKKGKASPAVAPKSPKSPSKNKAPQASLEARGPSRMEPISCNASEPVVQDPILLEEFISTSVSDEAPPLVLGRTPLSSIKQSIPPSQGSPSPSSVPLRKGGLAAKLRHIDGALSLKGICMSSCKQPVGLQVSTHLPLNDLSSTRDARGADAVRLDLDPSRGVPNAL